MAFTQSQQIVSFVTYEDAIWEDTVTGHVARDQGLGDLIEAIRALAMSSGAVTALERREEIARALAQEDRVLWVDIRITEESDATILSDLFQFHPLAIEDAVSPRVDPPKIDDHGEYIFVIVHALTEYQAHVEMEAVEVDFFLGPNYVVSCHREPLPAVDQFHARCLRNGTSLLRTPDWLLHGLLDAIVDEYLPIVDAVDDTLDDLEADIIQRPNTALLQQIMLVKRNAMRLRRAATPQRDILNRLSRGEFPKLIRQETSIYYRDIYDHLVRVEYLVEALRDLADGALNTYLSVVSNRLNEVMKVLTGATVIFLPGALIAGIYGTNFPEQHVWPPYDSEWGFAAIVGFIIAVIIAMLFYFRRRNWI